MTAPKPTPAELAALINATLKTDVLKVGTDSTYTMEYLETGVLPFDLLTQGGIARGRMYELFGPYSSLKTLIALKTCATQQAAGNTCAILDAEHAYDPEWAESMGVNTADLIVMQPETGEESIDALETLIRSQVDFLAVDSVTTLLPQSDRDQRLMGEKNTPATLARLMSKGLRKLTAANSQTAMLWLNQTRSNIGVTFGPRESTTGGNSLPYYASMRIHMRKTGKVTEPCQVWDGEKWADGKLQTGQKFSMILEKSKLNQPMREMHFNWDLKSADIDLPGFLIAQGMESGLIAKNGNTWTYQDTVKAVGREKFVQAFAANQTAMAMLETEVRQIHARKTRSSSSAPTKSLPPVAPSSPGKSAAPKKKAAVRKAPSPVSTEPASTPDPAQDASATTPPTETPSTSSSKPNAATA